MTTNERYYRNQINAQIPDYKISIRDFIKEITESNLLDGFKENLNDKFLNIFDIANDYSIPVSMVKYFKKVGF